MKDATPNPVQEMLDKLRGTTAKAPTAEPTSVAPVTGVVTTPTPDAAITPVPDAQLPAVVVPTGPKVLTDAELAEEAKKPVVIDKVEDVPQELLDIGEKFKTDPSAAAAELAAFHQKQLKAATDGIIQAIPATVANLVKTEIAEAEMRNDFFTKNPELVPYQVFVGTLATKLEKENPNMPAPELLAKIADEAKKAVNLSKQPSLPAAPGGGQPLGNEGTLTGRDLQKKEMADMISAVKSGPR